MIVSLGCALVGDGLPCYVIAEIGINHNGSVELATKLIEAAAEAGADAVKLQKRTIDACYTQEDLAKPRESPWGTTQRAQKEGLEFSRDAYLQLREVADGLGLTLTASAWDVQALDDICAWLDPPWLKVASTTVANHDQALLRAYGATGRPLIVSTGGCDDELVIASTEAIDHAVVETMVHQAIAESKAGHTVAQPARLVLLHCCATYPAEAEELNLSAITTMRERYRVPIGYSGHERGISTTVNAVALGACVVERHLTLDRTMYGSDQAASLEPKGFAQMVRDIRTWEAARGDGVKRAMPREAAVMQKLRRVGL